MTLQGDRKASSKQSAWNLQLAGGGASLLAHVSSFLLLVLVDWLGMLFFPMPTSEPTTQINLEARSASEPPRDWQGTIEITPPDEEALDDPAAVADSVLQRRVTATVESAQALPAEQQREQLEELAQRLGQVSSERSVEEVTGRLRQALGVKPRATEPSAEPVAGEFDVSTAQLHAVERLEVEGEELSYKLVLVDADGRRQEQQLGPEGESLYKTWQLIQKNPLLGRIYRGIVMQLLDQALGR
ncbi:MAG: hypothetical protein ACKPEY_01150 [Planctomycetota bacterium]